MQCIRYDDGINSLVPIRWVFPDLMGEWPNRHPKSGAIVGIPAASISRLMLSAGDPVLHLPDCLLYYRSTDRALIEVFSPALRDVEK